MLEETAETRLHDLFVSKCAQDGTMDFTNFLLLAVERNMVSNKFGLEIFYTAFKEAVDNRNIEQEVITGEPEARGDLTRNNFFLAITMLAQALYAD